MGRASHTYRRIRSDSTMRLSQRHRSAWVWLSVACACVAARSWNRGSWHSESFAAYEALKGLREPDGRIYFGGDYMTTNSSWMQGAFDSAREVATALHKRAFTRG